MPHLVHHICLIANKEPLCNCRPIPCLILCLYTHINRMQSRQSEGLASFSRTSTRESTPSVGKPLLGRAMSRSILLLWVLCGHNRLMLFKYRDGIFRIPTPTRWLVLVSGPKLTDELRKAPDDVLSFREVFKNVRDCPLRINT